MRHCRTSSGPSPSTRASRPGRADSGSSMPRRRFETRSGMGGRGGKKKTGGAGPPLAMAKAGPGGGAAGSLLDQLGDADLLQPLAHLLGRLAAEVVELGEQRHAVLRPVVGVVLEEVPVGLRRRG